MCRNSAGGGGGGVKRVLAGSVANWQINGGGGRNPIIGRINASTPFLIKEKLS